MEINRTRVRKTVTLSPESIAAIDEIRRSLVLDSLSQTLDYLIGRGLNAIRADRSPAEGYLKWLRDSRQNGSERPVPKKSR